jgi:hypothetical protein
MTSFFIEKSYSSSLDLDLDSFQSVHDSTRCALLGDPPSVLLSLNGTAAIQSVRRVFTQCERVSLHVTLSLRSLQSLELDEPTADRVALCVRAFLIAHTHAHSSSLMPLNEITTARAFSKDSVSLRYERHVSRHGRVSIRLQAHEDMPGISLLVRSVRLELHRTLCLFMPNQVERPLTLSLLSPTSGSQSVFNGHPLLCPCVPPRNNAPDVKLHAVRAAMPTDRSYDVHSDMQGVDPRTAKLIRSVHHDLRAKVQHQTIRGEPVLDLLQFLHYESGMNRPVAIVGGAVRDLLRGKGQKDINDIDVVVACDYKMLTDQIRKFFAARDQPLDTTSFHCSGAYERTGMVKILRLPGTDPEDLDIGMFKAQSLVVQQATKLAAEPGVTLERATLDSLVRDDSGTSPSYLFGFSWTTDACYRDFTTNAVYIDICEGVVYDPCDFLARDLAHEERGDMVSHSLVSAPLRIGSPDVDHVLMADVGAHFRLFKELMKPQDELGNATVKGDAETKNRLSRCATLLATEITRALDQENRIDMALFWMRKFAKKLFGNTVLNPAALAVRTQFLHHVVVKHGDVTTWAAIVGLCRSIVKRCDLFYVESIDDIRMFAVAAAVGSVVDDVVDLHQRHNDFRAMIDSDDLIVSSIADWHLETWKNDQVIVDTVGHKLRQHMRDRVVLKLLRFVDYVCTIPASIDRVLTQVVSICGRDRDCHEMSEHARTLSLDCFWRVCGQEMLRHLWPIVICKERAENDIMLRGALKSAMFSWHRLPDSIVKSAEFGDRVRELLTAAFSGLPSTRVCGDRFRILNGLVCDDRVRYQFGQARFVDKLVEAGANESNHYEMRGGALSCLRAVCRRHDLPFDERLLDRVVAIARAYSASHNGRSNASAVDAIQAMLESAARANNGADARRWASNVAVRLKDLHDVRGVLRQFLQQR